MHKIVKVGDLFGLPHHSYVFQLIYFDTLSRDSFGKDCVDLVSVVFIVKSEIVGFVCNYFKTNL